MGQVFMYKDGTGEPELFDAASVPKSGYSDNPKAAMRAKKASAKKPAATKKRARKDGKFVADDPSTPDINEAYE